MLNAKRSGPVWSGVIGCTLALFMLLSSACGGRSSVSPTSRQTGMAAESGAALFARSCAACHGAQAEGRPGLGPALVGNEFVDGLSDKDLLAFLIAGRRVTDPANLTGKPMPPRGGGNLTDDQLAEVITWLRGQVR